MIADQAERGPVAHAVRILLNRCLGQLFGAARVAPAAVWVLHQDRCQALQTVRGHGRQGGKVLERLLRLGVFAGRRPEIHKLEMAVAQVFFVSRFAGELGHQTSIQLN